MEEKSIVIVYHPSCKASTDFIIKCDKLKTYDKEYINLKDDKIETELNVDKVPLIIINNDQANIFKGKQAYDKLEEMILEEETPKKAANKTMKYGTKVNFIVPTDDKKERINLEKK